MLARPAAPCGTAATRPRLQARAPHHSQGVWAAPRAWPAAAARRSGTALRACSTAAVRRSRRCRPGPRRWHTGVAAAAARRSLISHRCPPRLAAACSSSSPADVQDPPLLRPGGRAGAPPRARAAPGNGAGKSSAVGADGSGRPAGGSSATSTGGSGQARRTFASCGQELLHGHGRLGPAGWAGAPPPARRGAQGRPPCGAPERKSCGSGRRCGGRVAAGVEGVDPAARLWQISPRGGPDQGRRRSVGLAGAVDIVGGWRRGRSPGERKGEQRWRRWDA